MSPFASAPRMADCIACQRYADEVLAPQMERAILKRIKELEAEGKYDTEEYDSLLVPYYERHVFRQPMESWPECVVNRSKELPSIGIPTLTIGAEYYIMDPAYMDWMATQFPNGSYLYCPDAGHMAMWDDPEGYHKGLADFINKV